jgi:CHAD domain-containing protein
MTNTRLRTELEQELKFDVAETWVLPDLDELAPPGGSIRATDIGLESTYYDTDSRDLLASGLTLRRRTGTTDEGWQLKVPAQRGRTEIRTPLDGRTAPRELQQLTLGVRRGARLRPILIMRTRRDARLIVDADTAPLAEVVVDHVTAETLGDSVTVQTWREVEVELKGGDEALLRTVGKWLRKTGAVPSRSGSKLARALGVAPEKRRRKPKTVHDAVRGYLAEQYEAIRAGDLALRRDEDVVHKTRVATRRYRSVLRIFATQFDRERAAALDAELKWYAGALGAVRDLQVLRQHLLSDLAELPSEFVLGPVHTRLTQTLDTEIAQARRKLATAMRSKRYLALLDELRAWAVDAPFTARAEPAKQLSRYVSKARRKYLKRLRAADALDNTDPTKDEASHRARKAAKRARYTADLAVPVLGKHAHKVANRAKNVQTELGDRQDARLAVSFLRRLGVVVNAQPDENGFTYGILLDRELHRGHIVLRGGAPA